MNAVFPQDGYGSALPRCSPDRRVLSRPKSGTGRVPSRPKGERGRVLRRPKGEGGPVRRSSKSEGGFTLVEMIAVLTIIAILAAAVTGGLVYANRKAAVTATKALFQKLEIGIRSFHADYGAYPPDRNPNWPNAGGWDKIDLSGSDPDRWLPIPDDYKHGDPDYTDSWNNLNTGAETLWYFLSGVYEDADPQKDLKYMEHKTAYVDFLEREVKRVGVVFWMPSCPNQTTDSRAPGDRFPEIVDAWGTPIQYNAAGGYFAQPATPPAEAKPLGNPDAFDLVSRGPDRLVKTPEYNEISQIVNGKYVNKDNVGNFTFQ